MADSALDGREDRYCPLCGERFEALESCPHDGAVLIIEQEADAMLGVVLGQGYRVDAFLGAGGMGRVYRGVQLSLDRPVAIKIIHVDHSADPHMVRRFLQEARLSSRLDHPNIVRVIDGGNTSEGRCYLVMELLEGVTLDAHVPEGGLPWAEARELFAQLCAGVEAFHRAGLVHRDLKPNNVLLCEREGRLQAKIFDFGLAKQLDADVTGLTAEGQFLGTPGYLAPEQMSSGEVTPRTDIYALGALLHYMLCKRPAFVGATAPAIVVKQLSGEFSVEGLPDSVPFAVRGLISRALEVEPEGRFASVSTLLAALDDDAHDDALAQDQQRAQEQTREREDTSVREALAPLPGADERPAPADERPARADAGKWSRRALLGAGVFGGALVGAGMVRWAWGSRGVISLGMSGPLSGSADAIGKAMQLGLEARFAVANANEELSRTIELEVLDDGYEAERARANVERLAASKLALVGNVGTATTAASIPAVLAAKLPLVGAHSGAEHLRRDPPDRYVFNFRAGYALETAALIEHFVRERYAPSSIAVFAQDDAFGASGVDGIRRALAGQGFLEFEELLVTYYPPNTMAVDAAVEQIRARAGLRVVILVAAYRAAAQLVASLGGANAGLEFAGISPVASSVFVQQLARLGHVPTGIILTQVVPDPASAANGVLRYREALAAHQARATPGVISLEGFIVADLVVEALQRCDGSFEREVLVNALESLDALDRGFGTPVSFSPSNHQGSRRVWATRFDAAGESHNFDLS